tara:strand:+ start:6858 stop:7526 length:669 start_codon:yes stop_codon:yes gene_type:complete
MNKIYILIPLFFITFNCIAQDRGKTALKNRENKHAVNNELTFTETQDSLRTLLLKSKPNENLKGSILQELYIRGLVNQVDDKISFELPFNLHGLDCLAPDCYTTFISFDIPAREPVAFPETINFSLSEYGCVEEEISINGVFERVEESPEYVNYFSKELKSNLIIKKDTGLYYYPHQNPYSVSVETVDKMFENYAFEKEDVIVPYRSNVMLISEYQHFIENE